MHPLSQPAVDSSPRGGAKGVTDYRSERSLTLASPSGRGGAAQSAVTERVTTEGTQQRSKELTYLVNKLMISNN